MYSGGLDMKKDLFICNTYYHLLISIIKSFNKKNESDIIITSDRQNCFLVNNKTIIEALKKSNIFKNIIIYNNSEKEIFLEKHKIRKQIFLRTQKNNFNYSEYETIYVYHEANHIVQIMNLLKQEYVLLEDGTDYFKNNFYYNEKKKNKKRLKTKIKHFLNIYDTAESKYIKYIEVNDMKNLKVYDKKIVECNKKELFNNLNDKQKKIILNIFIGEIKDYKKLNNSMLIITQPLNEDHHLNNEKEKIQLYKEAIKLYSSEDNVVIKTHPREVTNYKDFFPNYTIIDIPFPIEIINFFPIRFKTVLTLSSTSIGLIENVDEKKFLGWEWLDNYKKENNIK